MLVTMRAIALCLTIALAACPSEEEPRVLVQMELPREGLGQTFLSTPWPSDLMRTNDGLDLSRFPNPYGSSTLEDVLRLFVTNTGYPATGTLYFQVEGGIDEASLPQSAAASVLADSAMFLVETDTLARLPISWKQEAAGTSFVPPGTMQVQPLLGAVPRGRFALVVTADARAVSGLALAPSPEMLALSRCQPLSAEAAAAVRPGVVRAADCSPYQKLVDELGLVPENVALIQMITPADATGGLIAAAAVARELPPPSISDLQRRASSPSNRYDVYQGSAGLAQLQAGQPPFDDLDQVTGGFVLGADGRPEVQFMEDVRFILTVPRSPMPSSGYCVIINGHGTGGDYETGLGAAASKETVQAAKAGCALLTTSEPLHRNRRGYREGQEALLTFNFFNPLAGRDNWRQSAIEKVQLVTLARALSIPADISGSVEVRFDPERVSYFGHSQGGIAGALFVAVEDRIQGAFLSGAGAGFGPSIVEKVDPVAIKGAVRAVLLMPNDEDIDVFHPVIALLQSWVDPADPINYGHIWRERTGAVPHLVVSSGLIDTYTPPGCHAGLAGAFGLPLALPIAQDLPVLELLGVPAGAQVLQGNLTSKDGAPLTAGLLQYPEDGHFAVYDNEAASKAVLSFFTTLQEGVPSVSVE